MNKRLFVSTSGGRTSAYMAWWLLENCQDYELMFGFANTSEEDNDTYRFLDAINRNLLDNRLVCVEAVVDPHKGQPTGHRVVNFNELRRDGEVFEEMIAKYGIPNQNFPHCTRELKLNAMHSYVESVWGTNYSTAIGIRCDELRRVSKSAGVRNIVYPLIDWHPDPPDEDDIIDWFKQFPWDLRIPKAFGNCKTCWKKSTNRLMQVWLEKPEFFEFNRCMERDYGLVKPPQDPRPGPRVFFRGHRSTIDMIDLFKMAHADGRTAAQLERMAKQEKVGDCTDSCEMYPMER